MSVDALLAWLHFTAIFLLFAFLSVAAMLVRVELDTRLLALLRRVDFWYWGAMGATVLTGVLRYFLGVKGSGFYADNPVFWAKVVLLLATAVFAMVKSRRIHQWACLGEPVTDGDRQRVRRYAMIEVHLLAIIPLLAALMTRGIGLD